MIHWYMGITAHICQKISFFMMKELTMFMYVLCMLFAVVIFIVRMYKLLQ